MIALALVAGALAIGLGLAILAGALLRALAGDPPGPHRPLGGWWWESLPPREREEFRRWP